MNMYVYTLNRIWYSFSPEASYVVIATGLSFWRNKMVLLKSVPFNKRVVSWNMSIDIASICICIPLWPFGYSIASTRWLVWACYFALFRVGVIFEISIDTAGLIRHIASIWSAPTLANVCKICNINYKIKLHLNRHENIIELFS